MKKVLLVLLGVLFCVSAFADRDTAPASFQSEQYILNRIFESSTSGFIEANWLTPIKITPIFQFPIPTLIQNQFLFNII